MKLFKRKNKIVVAGVFASVLMAFSVLKFSDSIIGDNLVAMPIGHYELKIPKENLRSKSTPMWLRRTQGLDSDANSILVKFDASEIARTIHGYEIGTMSFRDDIRVLITYLTLGELESYLNPEKFSQLGDLWRMQGGYSNRIVEPFGSNGWYKVFRKIEHPNSWALLNRYPDESMALPNSTEEFWLAHCLKMGAGDNRNSVCRFNFRIHDLLIEFSISENNIHIIDEINGFLKSEISGWIL